MLVQYIKSMSTSEYRLYHEEQDYKQGWTLIPIIVGTLIMVAFLGYGMYYQLQLGKPWGDQPISDTGLVSSSIIGVVVTLGMALFVLNLRLIIEVRKDGFYYRFPVLINRMRAIRPSEIERYEVGRYHPLRDFGGWGIRYRPFRGRAYSISGTQGVCFYLKNGKKVVFGTKNPNELKRALDKMMTEQKN